MNKFAKSVLIGITSLGLLIPVNVFSSNSNNTIKASTNWKSGMPSYFKNLKFWISGYEKINPKDGWGSYSRMTTTLSHKYNVNVTILYYDHNKKFKTSGADQSATAAINPHYKSLGHGWYKTVSGDKSLHYELEHNANHYGFMNLIHIHDKNHISIWGVDKNKKSYEGYFTGYPYSNKLMKRFLK